MNPRFDIAGYLASILVLVTFCEISTANTGMDVHVTHDIALGASERAALAKAAPSVFCEGYFEPFQLAQCFESTDFFLQVPNGPTVQVKDERITIDRIAEMFTFLDSSDLESSAGFEIRSHGVHSVLYNTRVDLYHLIGRTDADEYFSVKLRKTANSDAAGFEISDWKCK